jgi:hypothetical protein
MFTPSRARFSTAAALFTFPRGADAQALPLTKADVDTGEWTDEGPSAALAFEKSFRGEKDDGKPVPLDACQNIRQLTEEFWSKKHVLTDFKQFHTAGQVGAIVIVKTEFCCDGSRLCAVTTACMEKKSTPLIGRFRIYAAWIKNSPEHEGSSRNQWDQAVIDEYGFIQGPGARIVVMVPTFDGKMYQWFSNASDLGLSLADFESNHGRTPELERFLAEAVKYVPSEVPDIKSTND